MNYNNEMSYPIDVEFLNSEEEFATDHPNHTHPSTSFFTTLPPRPLPQPPQPRQPPPPPNPCHQYCNSPEPEIPQQLSGTMCDETITTTTFLPQLLNSINWDQWLCMLAKSLTPLEWQIYWLNYLSQFGTTGLPEHLVNFFMTATATTTTSVSSTPTSLNKFNWPYFQQQQFYGL